MDSPYSPLEFALLNNWQRDFPLVSAPFELMGRQVGAGETAIVQALAHLSQRGAISRVGAVFAPRRLGAGALAAVAAPPERLEEVATIINACPSVNHNYQREHHYNLWFVVTAADVAQRTQVFEQLTKQTGCPVIAMPLAEEFHIDLGFDLRSGHSAARHECASAPVRDLSAVEKRLAAVLQDGLRLCERPFAELGERAGLSEDVTLTYLLKWVTEGLIKRFGVIVRHHELGYRANAMVVFDVPDEQASDVGRQLAAQAGVTLSYRRERCLPEWPYNLYCMVHGRSREEVAPVVAQLEVIAGKKANALFSVRRFKQCGARYFS